MLKCVLQKFGQYQRKRSRNGSGQQPEPAGQRRRNLRLGCRHLHRHHGDATGDVVEVHRLL